MQILKTLYSLTTGEVIKHEIVTGILAVGFEAPLDGLFPEEQMEDFNFPQSEFFEGEVVGLCWSHVREHPDNIHVGTNAWGVDLDPSDFVEQVTRNSELSLVGSSEIGMFQILLLYPRGYLCQI